MLGALSPAATDYCANQHGDREHTAVHIFILCRHVHDLVGRQGHEVDANVDNDGIEAVERGAYGKAAARHTLKRAEAARPSLGAVGQEAKANYLLFLLVVHVNELAHFRD